MNEDLREGDLMPWVADLHIHSHFSMATSKACNPANLYRCAALKGVSLVGTGDFTHPGWREELRASLLPAEAGFYRLKSAPAPEIPGQPEVRFVVTGELSTIYKKNGRTRKVHHLVVLPSLEGADRISARLEALGMNIRSDGRPILGLDSYLLLQLILEAEPEALFIPAHIWTPHFSVFGSNSGFDDLTECYADLSDRIFALETGLSSDPSMNWRWSALDRFTLISNSDAHNPQNLAREANLLTGEFSYHGLKKALEDPDSNCFTGTIEFFPEEGKYHLDGHRNCGICWDPNETRQHGAVCPICGRKITVGVLHRVTELADRPEGFKPAGAKEFLSLVPLREIIGAALNVGARTQKAEQVYFDLLHNFGPELDLLIRVDPDLIAAKAGLLVAMGIRRLRERKVEVRPGYDGEYGVISLFDEGERRAILGQDGLFSAGSARQGSSRKVDQELASAAEATVAPTQPATPVGSLLSPEQMAVIETEAKVVRVIAGPGTGKTRTLVERIAYLIKTGRANPQEITAVTFTNKAAAEIRNRLETLLQDRVALRQLQIGTFHSLAWQILNSQPEGAPLQLLNQDEAAELVKELLREQQLKLPVREAMRLLGLVKNKWLWDDRETAAPEALQLYQAYQQRLESFGRCDFDDLMFKTVKLWQQSPQWLQSFRLRFHYLLVDEFQDVNPAQFQLITQWAQDSLCLMVIGDPNQSIYGFRGSSSRFFDDLKQVWPDTVTLRLTHNFRSTAPLVQAANALIRPELRQQVPVGRDRNGVKLTWLKAAGERNCARAIAAEIVTLMGGSSMLSADRHSGSRPSTVLASNYSLADFAILYRTNRQAEAMEAALSVMGLPYRVVGPTVTLESESVITFLSFLRYLDQPDDPFRLRSAVFQTYWGLEEPEKDRLTQWLLQPPDRSMLRLPCLERVLGLAQGQLLQKLLRFKQRVTEFKPLWERKVPDVVAAWINQGDLQDFMELEHLSRIGENYSNCSELLRLLPLATEADIVRSSSAAAGRELITLSTIHASKGLEYPVVFLAGVEEGLLPFGAELSPEELAEEQRLFYVGLTRARERCYLVSSRVQFRNGETVTVEPSRFIRLLPETLLETVEIREKRAREQQLELF